jgi:FkbM family methyltransferase
MEPDNLYVRLLASCSRRLPVRGRKALARKGWRGCRPGGWWTVRLRTGGTVCLPLGSLLTWTVGFTGGYDDDFLDVLLPYFKPGTLALDVGASLGLYTIRFAMRAREIGGRVIAFEPVRANREVIESNLLRNALSSFVDVRSEALGDRNGVVPLHVERGGHGNAAIAEGVDPARLDGHVAGGRVDDTASANIRPLDELDLPPLRCSVMKLDVEGCELQVLLTMIASAPRQCSGAGSVYHLIPATPWAAWNQKRYVSMVAPVSSLAITGEASAGSAGRPGSPQGWPWFWGAGRTPRMWRPPCPPGWPGPRRVGPPAGAGGPAGRSHPRDHRAVDGGRGCLARELARAHARRNSAGSRRHAR